MPKQPNITLYSCDRPSCVNKEYVLPNATASPNWHEVTRVDRNGNQRKILFANPTTSSTYSWPKIRTRIMTSGSTSPLNAEGK